MGKTSLLNNSFAGFLNTDRLLCGVVMGWPIGCYGKNLTSPSFFHFSPGFNPLLKTLLNLVQGLVGIAQASAAKLHMVRNHVEI